MKKAPPLLAAAAALAALAATPAASATYKPFHTPSHKVRCAYFKDSRSTSLRCDANYRIKPIGQRRCTEGDFGASVAMSATGRAHGICVSDAIDTGFTAHYGRTYHLGPFTCTSRTSGLRCRNAKGHGWFLSTARQELF